MTAGNNPYFRPAYFRSVWIPTVFIALIFTLAALIGPPSWSDAVAWAVPIAGIVLGIFAWATLDDRINSAQDTEELLHEALLAIIPHKASKSRLSIPIVGEENVFAESYRSLRSSLIFLPAIEPRPKTFLITSAVPGEGKSTVALNLAVTMAHGGARTLLIDADLRRAVSHEYFSPMKPSSGLISVLTKDASWKQAVIATGVLNLSFLPRGTALAGISEQFFSKITDRLLKEVYGEFDFIIVDSAPVLANDDTVRLASKIEATLFVVRAGISAMAAHRALETLRNHHVNVLGIVLNAVDRKCADYYYYSYADYSQPVPREKV